MLSFRGSWYFWGLASGIAITVFMVSLLIPWYKILPDMPTSQIPLSGDTLTFDQTKDAFKELYDLISLQYYDTWSVDQTRMSRQAIASFVNALWDPFSSYLEPAEDKAFTDSIDGKETIDGIGAILSKKDAGVMIEQVLKSSPAAQSWLKPLDLIIKVNNTGVQNMTIGEVVGMIRWPRWTTVILSIVRAGSGWGLDFIDKSIIRDTITIPSVSSKMLTWAWDSPIAYIALSLFAQDTDELLQREIMWLKKQWFSGMILDLRGNGWWLLPESVTVASHFLTWWIPIVQAKYRLYTDKMYISEWKDDITVPLVILVDSMTASASEIIALGIKEGRCKVIGYGTWWVQSGDIKFDPACNVTIVGTRTFGKWSIQNLQQLNFWWSLKLTVGKRFPPSGRSIDHIGIIPDSIIEIDSDLYIKKWIDNQLEKAKDILSQRNS
jgi:carboxyl-terminal processing protease